MKNERTNAKKLKNLKRNVKGITLIALVVTIIVLLILAGVAINLSIGQNGIFSRAQGASSTWKNAETNEQLALGEGSDLIDRYIDENDSELSIEGEYNVATTVSDAKSQNKFFRKETTIKDDLLNDVTIPGGFKVTSGSATKVEDGIVIEDKDGNQFVWILVPRIEEIYKQTGIFEQEFTQDVYDNIENDLHEYVSEYRIDSNGNQIEYSDTYYERMWLRK